MKSSCAARRTRLLRSAAALLALPLISAAGQAGNGLMTLRMKFKKGEIRKYQTSVQMSLGGAPPPGKTRSGSAGNTSIPIQAINALEQYKVVKLLPNGGAQVDITTLSGQNAAGPLQGGSKPIHMVFDSRGKLMAVSGLTGGPGGALLGNMFGSSSLGGQGAALPPKPVKVGDTWQEPVTVPNVGIGAVKGTFAKIETVGSYKTAQLHYIMTIPIKTMIDSAMQPTTNAAQATMTTSGTLHMTFDNNFAIAEGKLVRTSGNGLIDMTLKMKPAPARPGAPKAAPAPAPRNMTVQLSVGTTLVE